MKSLWKRITPLHPRAREVALTGLRMAVILLFCQLLLRLKATPLTIDTYEIFQMQSLFGETVRAVLLITAIGTVWLQSLFTAQK